MNKLIKGTALTLAAVTLFTTTAFAAAVPLRETFEKAGFKVTWNQETKTVTIEKDSFTFSESVGENISLDYDTTYATDEFVNEIYADYNREALSTNATVKDFGEGYILAYTEKLGEVMFMVDENTFYHHEINRKLYTFSDITAGASLKIYFGEAMTASVPPQTYATEIVFLDSAPAEESALTKTGKITEIGEGYFAIETENGAYQFNVDEETFYHHTINRMLYRFESLEDGIEVEVIHSDAATFSLPPQSYAIEVIIK